MVKSPTESVWFARLIAVISISRKVSDAAPLNEEDSVYEPPEMCAFVRWFEECGVDETTNFKQLKWAITSPFNVIKIQSVHGQVHVVKDSTFDERDRRFLVNRHASTLKNPSVYPNPNPNPNPKP
jgi:hypothetical protein